MADDQGGRGNRDRYRDNDDVRDPMSPDDRNEVRPDTRDEARGDARENVGRNARGTDANVTGPEGNDRTKRARPDLDEFQDDLERRVE
ncbi:MAG: hypothetical protein V4617_01430 [Gemmatimonadota bacterium]